MSLAADRIALMETEPLHFEKRRLGSLLLPALLLFSLFPGAPGTAAEEDAGSARLSYTRVLKGSAPEYLAITVNSDGTGTYEGRRLQDSPTPRAMRLSAATTQRLFALAGDLNYFQAIDLESHKKVANLGQKAFTYEKGGQKWSVEFNYTLRKEAQELTDIFEKIATVEQHIQTLEFAIKYDHLGLPGELLRIQIDLGNRALADPEMMVPTLQEIASNPRFLHLAQVRAQNILQQVESTNR